LKLRGSNRKRKLYNEELCNLYSLSKIIRVIIWRRMRWARHVAHVEVMRNVYKILVRKLEGIDGRTMLKWILQK